MGETTGCRSLTRRPCYPDGAPIRAKQLSLTATAWAICLCTCVTVLARRWVGVCLLFAFVSLYFLLIIIDIYIFSLLNFTFRLINTHELRIT